MEQSVTEMASDQVGITLCGAGTRCQIWEPAAGTDEAVVIAPSSRWVASCRALLTAQVALSQYPPPPLPGQFTEGRPLLKEMNCTNLHKALL